MHPDDEIRILEDQLQRAEERIETLERENHALYDRLKYTDVPF